MTSVLFIRLFNRFCKTVIHKLDRQPRACFLFRAFKSDFKEVIPAVSEVWSFESCKKVFVLLLFLKYIIVSYVSPPFYMQYTFLLLILSFDRKCWKWLSEDSQVEFWMFYHSCIPLVIFLPSIFLSHSTKSILLYQKILHKEKKKFSFRKFISFSSNKIS